MIARKLIPFLFDSLSDDYEIYVGISQFSSTLVCRNASYTEYTDTTNMWIDKKTDITVGG